MTDSDLEKGPKRKIALKDPVRFMIALLALAITFQFVTLVLALFWIF